MGNASSKAAAKTASQVSATNTARRYPTRSPPTSSKTTNAQPTRPSPNTAVGPQVHPEPNATSSRDHAINLDASDPNLAARLQKLGPVQPKPTQSNSSTFNSPPSFSTTSHFQPSSSTPSQAIFPSPASNPAVSLLTARHRIAEEADREFEEIGRRGAKGRTFLDVVTLRQVLVLRDRGVEEGEIERRFELGRGVVGRLGGRGVVSVTG